MYVCMCVCISHNTLMEGQVCGEIIIVYRKEWELNSGFQQNKRN